MDAKQQIDKFKEFLETNYYDDLLSIASKNEDALVIEFSKLSMFDIELAEILLEQPEELIKAAEYALSKFDIGIEDKTIAVRFKNLPSSSQLLIRNIRSKQLNKFYQFKGLVRQKSDVRPQVTSAKFECPSCGNIIPVLQLDQKFKEPGACSVCGRKGKFNLLNKELVDAQKIVLEEDPEDLEGSEQPKRINIFLKNDLASPISDKRTNPGSKIVVTGIIKEVPITLQTGGKSTRFDLMLEGNYVEPLQEEFQSLKIAPEKKEELLKLSKDPEIYEKLVTSMAPTIYGHERIKEALMLQMFGGRQKSQDDGVTRRGDIHVLLIGDPGSGKSQLLKRVSHVAPKSRFVSGKGASGAGLCVSPNSNILTSSGAMENIKSFVEYNMRNPEEYRPGIFREKNATKTKILSMSKELNLQTQNPQTIWKLKAPKEMYRIILRSGKKIEITENTKLFTIRNGKANWIKAVNLKETEYIGTPRKTKQGIKNHIDTLSLIQSNPVIHEVKEDVKDLAGKLAKKYGNLREAAKKTNLSEGSLYYNWTNQNARGNIKLKDYLTLLSETKTTLQKKELKISIYNGKKHKLPLNLSENFLYFAGLIAGDGDIRKSGETYSIRLSGKTKELHREFRKTLDKVFSLKYDIQKATEARPESTRTHSKILKEILLGLGIPLSPKSHRINLTNKITELKNKPLAAFIAGLYDSDGCISKRSTKGSDSIQYYTTSEILARQVQLILQRYEIHSKIRRREPVQGKIKSKHTKWCLEITGSGNIKRFKKNIPLKHPEKKKTLENIELKPENSNIDIIPSLKAKVLSEIKTKLNKEDLKYFSSNNESSTLRLKSILKKYKDELSEDTKKIINSDIRWDEIKKIEKFKTTFDWVYDLTVNDSHNFVVDGVLVHNTAAVVRDEFIRGWALEAGALVLANKGMVCIDELDKMTKEDTSAMHEALEQQSISISKANIQATLKSETTVLAAANPKFGRFDPYDILVKQIDLPPTLINRFDLIFPVKDLPDKDRDTKLASFILKLHKDQTSDEVALDTDTIKLYIAYAKQNIYPQLTEPALKEIQDYFVSMRNQGSSEEKIQNIPISARQLEGLVRLSEASAKTRLSNKVTKSDAKRAIDLLHYCLTLIGLDEETGKFDIDRIATGITASQRGNIHVIKEIIQDLENSLNAKIIPMDDIVREAEIKGIPESKTEEILEGLKRKGDIYNPKPGQVSRM